MPINEVLEQLRETIAAHYYNMVSIFEDMDYGGIGVVTKDDFRGVITKQVFRLTDEQVGIVKKI